MPRCGRFRILRRNARLGFDVDDIPIHKLPQAPHDGAYPPAFVRAIGAVHFQKKRRPTFLLIQRAQLDRLLLGSGVEPAVQTRGSGHQGIESHPGLHRFGCQAVRPPLPVSAVRDPAQLAAAALSLVQTGAGRIGNTVEQILADPRDGEMPRGIPQCLITSMVVSGDSRGIVSAGRI
jgi:hypothetical protein